MQIHHLRFTLLLLTAWTISSCQNKTPAAKQLAAVISPPSNPFDTITCPLRLFPINPNSAQRSFVTVVAHTLKAKLIPNNERREQLGITKITGIFNVTHFFLDHDLTTGYVHHYTQNFFNLLRPDDFVMKFDRVPEDSTVGYVSYIRKKDMQATDKLGKNIAFFRQWKLSEIDYYQSGDKILIKVLPSKFAQGCVSPNNEPEAQNPFGPQLPFRMQSDNQGDLPLDYFNKLDDHNGGTVVLIWEDKPSHQILFQDVHGSLYQVITRAIEISKQYNCDPSIAISDAGPMANKYLSNNKLELDCRQFPLQGVPFAAAGFGYVPQKYVSY